MIYIFGDSHANSNFKNLQIPNINGYTNSITMHRIGRDKLNCINFKNYNISQNDIVIYQVGEVDCRCHIGKQLLLNRTLDEIVETLTQQFMESIFINLEQYRNEPVVVLPKIIVCCIPPPMNKTYYTEKHGEITHKYPFIGDDKERSQFTTLVNNSLKEKCEKNGFSFLDYYQDYTNENGTIIESKTDDICHILDTTKIEIKLNEILQNF